MESDSPSVHEAPYMTSPSPDSDFDAVLSKFKQHWRPTEDPTAEERPPSISSIWLQRLLDALLLRVGSSAASIDELGMGDVDSFRNPAAQQWMRAQLLASPDATQLARSLASQLPANRECIKLSAKEAENEELREALHVVQARMDAMATSDAVPTAAVNFGPALESFDRLTVGVAGLRQEVQQCLTNATTPPELLPSPHRVAPVPRSRYVSRTKKRAFRISHITSNFAGLDGQREKSVWKEFRGVFVVLQEGCEFAELEKEFLDAVKEQDPDNIGVLGKVKEVVFWEHQGPKLTQKVWAGVFDILTDLEAELVF